MKFEIIKAGSRIGRRQVLGVALYEGFTAVDLAPLPSSIALLVEMYIPRENFKAKRGSTLVVRLANGETQCVVLAGLGVKNEARPDCYRLAAYHIVRTAATRGAASVSMAIPEASERSISRCVGEGAALACYRFEKYHAHDEDDRFSVPESVAVLAGDQKALSEGFTIGECQCYSRDLANEPGNVINPGVLAKIAGDLAFENGLKIKVLDEHELAAKGMNALLSVGKGSVAQPRLIHVEYTPSSRAATVALVGKGITFDSGGLDIKPSDFMKTMKGDKTGACNVIGIMQGVAVMTPSDVEVHGIIAAAENMPSGTALRPDDIIRARNGKTIEIDNTDAEGRLVLADALCVASELEPDVIVDMATLTGACAVALGNWTAGVFTMDDALSDALIAAGRRRGERIWRLPMDDEKIGETLKSKFADLVNGAGRYGGATFAAMFLSEFVDRDVAWAHLDIAGVDFYKEEWGVCSAGASAWGVRTCLDFLAGSDHIKRKEKKRKREEESL